MTCVMQKHDRKNPPIRDGRRITFQISNEIDIAIRSAADDEFPTVAKKGRLSALIRKAVELYLAERKANLPDVDTQQAKRKKQS